MRLCTLVRNEKKIWSLECKYFEIIIHLTDIDANIDLYCELVQPPSLWTDQDFIYIFFLEINTHV